MQENITEAIRRITINIRTIREFRNYSQSYMGSKLGLTQNGYSKIELNQSPLNVDRLYDIAAVLDVHVLDLMKLDLTVINKVQAKKIQVAIELPPKRSYVINYFRKPSEIDRNAR